MKNKNFGVKVLALILCLVVTLSCLYSCVSGEELKEVNTRVDDINTELGTLENGKVDKATYDALDAFVKEIDVIAKAAVSTAKFDEVLNNLNASIATKADAAKVSEDITAAKNALVEMINANAAEDATVKEALEAALVRITALEGSVATKAALESAISGINSIIAADKAAIEAKMAEIETLVAKKADKATVDGAIAELASTVAANKTAAEEAIAVAKSTLEEKISAANTALEELSETVAANNTAAEAAIAAAKAELYGAIDTTNTALDTLAATVENNNNKVTEDIADLNEAIENLRKAHQDNANKIAELKSAYEAKVDELVKADGDNTALINALTAKYNAEVEALKKADTDNKAALEKALADEVAALTAKYDTAVEALETANEANAKEIENLSAELAEKVEALEKADAANRTALEDKIAEEIDKVNKTVSDNAKAANDKVAALETKVDGIELMLNSKTTEINNTVDTKIQTLKNELNNKIDALQASYDSFVTNTNTEISNINALIKTINGQIEALQKDCNSFAENYQKATDMLYEGEYSIDSFEAKVSGVLEADYEKSVYEEFKKEVERLTFFLGRAITEDAIIGYFEQLDQLIEGMPTLMQSLRDMLNAYTENAEEGKRKYLTTNPNELDNIDNLYNKIETVDEDLETLYNAISAAHDNLVLANGAAEDVKVNINNIAAPIVYVTSEPAIVYAEDAFDVYATTYFADTEMTKYYGETTAASLVTNYTKLTEYRARYDVLVSAADNKVVFVDAVLNYATDRPLWSDLSDIAADKVKYDEWLTAYEIDTVVDAASISTIYGGELELLAKADVYATYMDSVYTDNGVEALVTQITEYVSATNVLYETKETCDALNVARETVKDAIESADDYVAEYDNNYVTMFTQENIDKLAAATARIAELVEAKAKIDAVYAEMDAMLNKDGGITYDDSAAISQFKPALDKIYVDYEISTDKDADENYVDQNYVALATATEAKYDELIDAYMKVIREVVELIEAINKQLTAIDWLLSDGKQIQKIDDSLYTFINVHKVTDVNLWVPKEEENINIDVNLYDLQMAYYDRASEYSITAKEAADAAIAVNDVIEALATVNAGDVKNYAVVKAAYDAFVAWCDEYLDADIAAAGDVAAAIKEIQSIEIFDVDPAVTYYAFVSEDNYSAVLDAYNTANDTMTAAETEWNAIYANIATLIAGWDIHSYEDKEVNFLAVKAAYDAYVVKYYDTAIDADTDVFGELDDANVPAFEIEMAKCKTALDNADAAAQAINDKIAALPAVTINNATEVLDSIAIIRSDIADYEASYCTDNCMFGDNLITLYKSEKIAEYAVANKAATEMPNADLGRLEQMWITAFNNITVRATSIEEARDNFNAAMSIINTYVETLQAQP